MNPVFNFLERYGWIIAVISFIISNIQTLYPPEIATFVSSGLFYGSILILLYYAFQIALNALQRSRRWANILTWFFALIITGAFALLSKPGQSLISLQKIFCLSANPIPLISSPTPISSPTLISSPTPTNKYKEKYERGEYPISQCGKVSSRPVHPIFIPRGSNDFEKVRDSFCQDAKDWGDKIQVASFSDEEEANMFLEFIREHFKGAWKGQPQ